MSNVKRMDIWTAVRTVLEKNPDTQAQFLINKVREKTGLSRSTIYDHLSSFVLSEKVFREKGRYWLKKPQVLSERNLERIRSETEKIKEDYFQGRRYRAVERMILLGATLPKGWQKEVELLITEAEKDMKETSDKLGIKIEMNKDFVLDPVMIPEILIKLHQLIESCEQELEDK